MNLFIIIKQLLDENQRLPEKCKNLESRLREAETDINLLKQYGRRNNIVFTVAPESIDDEQLESTVTSILSDTDVALDVNSIKDSHHFGKVDSISQSKKIIVSYDS